MSILLSTLSRNPQAAAARALQREGLMDISPNEADHIRHLTAQAEELEERIRWLTTEASKHKTRKPKKLKAKKR